MDDIPEIGEVDKRLDRLEERIMEGPEEGPETDLDRIIREHTNGNIEAFLCRTVGEHLVRPTVEEADPEQIRRMVEEGVILPRAVMRRSRRLMGLSTWIARIGGRAVREDWGDEVTRDAFFHYCRACIPQFEIVSDPELKDWIEANLEWIREKVLRKSAVSGLVERMKSALGGG